MRYDVVHEQDGLRELSDEAVFATAKDLDQIVVTENVKDFAPIETRARARGEVHPGLIFTSNRSFPRHRQRFIGATVTALDNMLSGKPDCSNTVHWLQPPAL